MPKRLILELRDDVCTAEIVDALEQVGEQLPTTLSGVLVDTNRLSIGSWAIDGHQLDPVTCAHCRESWALPDANIEETWQQWQCPACSSWNDKEARHA